MPVERFVNLPAAGDYSTCLQKYLHGGFSEGMKSFFTFGDPLNTSTDRYAKRETCKSCFPYPLCSFRKTIDRVNIDADRYEYAH